MSGVGVVRVVNGPCEEILGIVDLKKSGSQTNIANFLGGKEPKRRVNFAHKNFRLYRETKTGSVKKKRPPLPFTFPLIANIGNSRNSSLRLVTRDLWLAHSSVTIHYMNMQKVVIIVINSTYIDNYA